MRYCSKGLISFAVGLAVFATGCKDTSGPPPDPFAIQFSVSTDNLAVSGDTVRCHFVITATAFGGEQGAYALWHASDMSFFDPVTYEGDEYLLTQTDMLDYFGVDRIVTGETREAHRVLWWNRPFLLQYHFRYEDPEGLDVTQFEQVDCTGWGR